MDISLSHHQLSDNKTLSPEQLTISFNNKRKLLYWHYLSKDVNNKNYYPHKNSQAIEQSYSGYPFYTKWKILTTSAMNITTR